jgi:hypothetical protein
MTVRNVRVEIARTGHDWHFARYREGHSALTGTG